MSNKSCVNKPEKYSTSSHPMLRDLKDKLKNFLLNSNWLEGAEDLIEEAFSEPKIALMGKTGVGKTSTVNALFNPLPLLEVGHVRATTKDFQEIQITLGEKRGNITIIDCPGLCESLSADKNIISSYRQKLEQCDVVLWVVKADDRTLAIEQKYISDLFTEDLINRLVIGVNQIDLMFPNNWSIECNLPSEEQEKNINAKILYIREKLKEINVEPRAIVPYSALRVYRLVNLFKEMLNACPSERILALSSKRKISRYHPPNISFEE